MRGVGVTGDNRKVLINLLIGILLSIVLIPAYCYPYSSVETKGLFDVDPYSQKTTHELIVGRAVKLVCDDNNYEELCNELVEYFGTSASWGLYMGSNDEDFASIKYGIDKTAKFLNINFSASLERGLNHVHILDPHYVAV